MTTIIGASRNALEPESVPTQTNGRPGDEIPPGSDSGGLDARDEARSALEMGWRPIPVPRGSKNPGFAGWNELCLTFDDLDRHFGGHPQNLAVLNGEPSGGLVDVDLDHQLAIKLAPNFLPGTNRVFGRLSKPRSHWEYLADPLPPTEKFQDLAGGVLVEIRGTGTATVWPGSQHPSGELVSWNQTGDPGRVDGVVLRSAVARLAAAALLVQHYPAPGGRDDFKLPLTGMLLQLGWEDSEIAHFIRAVAEGAEDEETGDRLNAIERTRARLANGEAVAGWNKLGDLVGNRFVAKKIRTWLDPKHGPRDPIQWQRKEDFEAYLPEHKYIFIPTGALWPAKSVRECVPPVVTGLDANGEEITVPADVWLDTHRAVQQMTWSPGLPRIIEGHVLLEGGWVAQDNIRAFNLYAPPVIHGGDPDLAGPWVDHVRRVYPDDADHLIAWFAHRVQHPGEKTNHAVVLGGAPGIGKDTILTPVKHAVGPWNVKDVSPGQVMGRFNGFLRSVILQVSEARDLGEVNRYSFHEHMKAYTAAPPDTVRCDEKFVGEYPVLNVCGVVYTTNHRTDGLYLPQDDRRHYVAWSDLTPEDVEPGYFDRLYAWFEEGGNAHVAAFLAAYDLSRFNPKAPPPKTRAFWGLVNASRSPEDADLADAVDALGRPDVVTMGEIISRVNRPTTPFDRSMGASSSDLGAWLGDRRNARQIPHRMESAGYVAVDNPNAKDGVWKVNKKRTKLYAQKDLSHADQMVGVRAYIAKAESGVGS